MHRAVAESRKSCGGCGLWLPIEQFAFRRRALGTRQGQCRACHSKASRDHYERNRARYRTRISGNNKRIRLTNRRRLHELLADASSADCATQDFAVLEFDHRDSGAKLSDTSLLVRRIVSWSKFRPSSTNANVVCANCHRRRTAHQFGWHKVSRPEPPPMPLLPKRGTPEI